MINSESNQSISDEDDGIINNIPTINNHNESKIKVESVIAAKTNTNDDDEKVYESHDYDEESVDESKGGLSTSDGSIDMDVFDRRLSVITQSAVLSSTPTIATSSPIAAPVPETLDNSKKENLSSHINHNTSKYDDDYEDSFYSSHASQSTDTSDYNINGKSSTAPFQKSDLSHLIPTPANTTKSNNGNIPSGTKTNNKAIVIDNKPQKSSSSSSSVANSIIHKIEEESGHGHISDVLTTELRKVHRRMSTSRQEIRLEELQQITGETIENLEKLDHQDNITNMAVTNKKMEIQSEYIQKIEMELQNEIISRKKLLIYLRNSERNVEKYKEKNDMLTAKLVMKETIISELREGVKSLESQLSLMDDKCINLRIKLNNIYKSNNKKEKKKKDLLLKTGGLLSSPTGGKKSSAVKYSSSNFNDQNSYNTNNDTLYSSSSSNNNNNNGGTGYNNTMLSSFQPNESVSTVDSSIVNDMMLFSPSDNSHFHNTNTNNNNNNNNGFLPEIRQSTTPNLNDNNSNTNNRNRFPASSSSAGNGNNNINQFNSIPSTTTGIEDELKFNTNTNNNNGNKDYYSSSSPAQSGSSSKMSLDNIQEKIRKSKGIQQEWTPEKLKQLLGNTP